MNISYAKYLMQKTKRDYDEIAEEFSATRKTMWPELADLDKYVKAGDKILDVGCGNGRLFGYLLERTKSISYAGIDISEKLIDIAKKDFAGSNAEFRTFDGINIPYPDNGLDVIFCLATLPHLPSEELRIKFLENIGKAAKPGALLVITSWNLWQFKFIPNLAKMIANFITDKIFGKGLPRYPDAQINKRSDSDKPTFLSKLSHFCPLGNGGRYDWGDFYIPWHKRDGKIISRYYHSFTPNELGLLLEKSGWEIKELGYKKRHGAKNFNLFAVAIKST